MYFLMTDYFFCLFCAGDGFRNWQIYSAGHRSRGIKFLDASPRFYFSPQARGLQGNYDFRDSGSASLFKVFHDLDGSIIGGKGGYLVTNNKVILPSNPKACYVRMCAFFTILDSYGGDFILVFEGYYERCLCLGMSWNLLPHSGISFSRLLASSLELNKSIGTLLA